MTHTSTPRKRKTVKKRRLSVELWLQGQQLHRMQGAEPQRQDACGEGGDGPLLSASSPLPRPSTRHPPGAHCLPPGQYLQTYVEPSCATLQRDMYSPDVTPFNSQAQGRGQGDQGWKRLGCPRTHSQQATECRFKPGSILRGYCGFPERELRSHCFLFQMKQSGKRKSKRPILSLASHVTLYLPSLNLSFPFHKMEIRRVPGSHMAVLKIKSGF